MTAATSAPRAQVLRVAAVWGTTVLGTRTLDRGESFVLGEGDPPAPAMPEGIDMPQTPVRAVQGGWEIDARGTVAGLLRLRGRDEDPVAIGRTGAPVAIMPGDHGLLQYGLFAVFFQYASPGQQITTSFSTDVLTSLSVFSSLVFHAGVIGFVFWAQTPPQLSVPTELLPPDELAARFKVSRADLEPPPAAAEPGQEKGGGSGVKDPGAHDKKSQGGGRKIQGAEGKLGLNGKESHTEIQGEIKPTTAYGGLSEVLAGETGEQIKSTLQTINTVANALSGLNSANIVLGSGSGTGLKGAGGGGGGAGAGVAFGSGTLDTGWGAGRGGGFGAGGGGPGGRGSGGNGRGGTGGGTGTGNGTGGGPGEAKVTVGGGGVTRGGLSGEQIQRVVRAHLGALRACYESEAQRNPNLKGGVTMAWQIQPDGSVASPQVASSTLNNPRVEGCVVRQVRGWHFPASETPTSVPSFPFSFAL
ncbi:MAG TPA: AgmX/PglI C-terminal domain-containing protein [Polyangiaceae bacterium]|jgi:hypothetical protein